ncbi:MAG: DUF5305 domain-containing protein [Defluviitaleaceae bacterium]|nr:DUF5305 domain-containing protein [Defluviitaleaceae bacterium]
MGFNKLRVRLTIPKIMIAVSAILLFAMAIIAFVFLVTQRHEEESFRASGSAGANFRVFYIEGNELFAENPIDPSLGFLMSLTDFVEIDSHLNVLLDEESDIHYSYEAVQHLTIRYMGNISGQLPPVVYRLETPLSARQGSIRTNSFSLSTDIATIYPKKYFDLYLGFVESHRGLMVSENTIATGFRGFTAEISISFSYNISVPAKGINERIEAGYRIPISSEVYSMLALDEATSSFSRSIPIGEPPPRLTVLSVAIYVFFVALAVLGLQRGIHDMHGDSNPHRHKALILLKKYENEIVVSDTILDFPSYKILNVATFHDLLKLSVNLNKHIMCYHNDEMATFAVLVDENAYFYGIDYDAKNDETILKDTVPDKLSPISKLKVFVSNKG